MATKIYRTQVMIGADMVSGSPVAKDYFTCTPWFQADDAIDFTAFATALANVFVKSSDTNAWVQTATETVVKIYEHTPGSLTDGPPVKTLTLYSGAYMSSKCPREISLCLSFYAGVNTPRSRGRLYLPVALRPAGESVGVRPPTATRNGAHLVAVGLAGVMGTQATWGMYSRASNVFRAVTNHWVDDEWDTTRSRGLRATTRDSYALAG